MSLRDEVIALENRYIVQTYRRSDFVLDRGEGVYLYDTDGNRYLDFSAGIAVNALGYGDPEIMQVIQDQAGRYFHVSNLYHMEPMARLAQSLADLSFGDRVFFCNSGAEANEGAFKFARKWGRRDGADRYEIVAFTGAFHGRTFGALAATPREQYQAPFRPLIGGVSVARFNDLDSAERAVTSKTCAIVVEPIQGEGGINVADGEFIRGLRRLCDDRGLLLIVDEVQCGLGRTGRLWAYQQYGIEPDMMTLAKPLGGGLPMGAVVVTEDVASVIEPGDHGSTFAANALISRVAQVVVRRVSDEGFLAHVRDVGGYLGEQLRLLAERKPNVVEVRGMGLMWALELTDEAAPYVSKGYREGAIMLVAGPRVLRLLPPLVIGKEHVDEMIAILDRVLPDQG
ncbi:MAG: aspartate aminotransferase family protein [Anaerolineae bacterium]|nr:aspartate aminotransferase family protein [Anaerolineae bacterium]